MDLVPRRAEPADLEALLRLIAEFYEVDHHPFDRAVVEPALLPMLTDDSLAQIWVLDEEPGDLTGYVIVTWSWALESGGRDCILDEIFVRDQSRGRGSLLVAHALTEARRLGARAMFLETEAPNDRARRFYARHGFLVEDSVWMSARLR